MGKYEIYVDDNFHYMDESYRYKGSECDSPEEALTRCKEIVDRSLVLNYREGMDGNQLWECYKAYGQDPFIRGEGKIPFSAWTYAKDMCMNNIEQVKQNYASAGPEVRDIADRNEAFDTLLVDMVGKLEGVDFTPRVKRH